MENNQIFLSSSHFNHSALKYVEDAISKNEISNYGTNIDAFEASLKTYLADQT